MTQFGTLGTNFAQNPTPTGSEICPCTIGLKCFNHHSPWGTVCIEGECAVCARTSRDLAHSEIDLSGQVKNNWMRNKMSCGHRPVGISNLWACLNVSGFVIFEISSQCVTCAKEGGVIVMQNEKDCKHAQDIRARECCDDPKVKVTRVTFQFKRPGETVKVKPEFLRFSQDTCSYKFSRGKASGKTIEYTTRQLWNRLDNVKDIETLKAVVQGTQIYVDGNRRLKAYQDVPKQMDLKVPVILGFGTPEKSLGHKFTTKNNGESIRVRTGLTQGKRFEPY